MTTPQTSYGMFYTVEEVRVKVPFYFSLIPGKKEKIRHVFSLEG